MSKHQPFNITINGKDFETSSEVKERTRTKRK